MTLKKYRKIKVKEYIKKFKYNLPLFSFELTKTEHKLATIMNENINLFIFKCILFD